MSATNEEDEWAESWTARVAAIEQHLGPMDNMVGHATIPFFIGSDLGGEADIIYFSKKIEGVISVTSELIGRDDQVQNDLGNYELAICHRDDNPWGANLISRLAHYTLRARLNPGETMDLGDNPPEGSTVVALLFIDFGRFTVRGRDAGLLLCIGITSEELDECRKGNTKDVIASLQEGGVYPFTDLQRKSVSLKKKWRWF